MTLHIVSTPIGNLGDISPRAIDTLRSVSLILAEDTRHTGKLLKALKIDTPMLSYHQHSNDHKTQEILQRLTTEEMALVSDAGTPVISDPGQGLVQAAIAAGITVSPVPGASAATTALMVSGFKVDRFVFLGFLPKRTKRQQDAVRPHLHRHCPIVLYESPHRLTKTLENLRPLVPNAQVLIGRELTKQHEEFIRGAIEEAIEQSQSMVKKGECVVVINPAVSG